jgi:hypothetical protein
MNTHLTAAACSGTWSQKLKCGWNEPTTTAAHAGSTFGHDVLPALILLAVVILVIMAARKRKGRGSTPTASPARARAGARR